MFSSSEIMKLSVYLVVKSFGDGKLNGNTSLINIEPLNRKKNKGLDLPDPETRKPRKLE